MIPSSRRGANNEVLEASVKRFDIVIIEPVSLLHPPKKTPLIRESDNVELSRQALESLIQDIYLQTSHILGHKKYT